MTTTLPATSRMVLLRRQAPIHIIALIIALSGILYAQSGPDSILVRFNPDIHHPENLASERLTIIDTSLRVHDFTRAYSLFDSFPTRMDAVRGNRLFADELQYRFSQGKNPISLSIREGDNVLVVEPILGYKVVADKEGQRFHRRTNGVKFFGQLGQHMAFYASAIDNLERGKILDRKKELERTNGFVISNDKGAGGFDFDEAQVQVSFRWGDAQLFLEKIRNRWGYGESGNLVLSEKAPSYPKIRIAFQIAKQLRLTSLLASLYSDVVDSLESYLDPVSGSYRKVYRTKYLAVHVLEYAPSSTLNIALGESMVFSDRFQAAYLLPLLFFRSAEHQNRNTDNAQLFAGLRYTVSSVGTLYGTLFIDDLNVDKIFSAENTNIVGWTLGGTFIDILWDNLDITFEYTRLNPWVYTHKFQAASYTSSGYVLGHWLGQNADVVHAKVHYRWLRSLWLNLYAQRFRKGLLGPSEVHYSQPSAQKFLEGPIFKQTQAGLKARWEIYRNLFLNCDVALWNQVDEVQNRHPSFSNRLFTTIDVSYNLFE